MTTDKENKSQKLEAKINHLIDSMEYLLGEFPSLQVNTIVVDNLIPDYFIPEKIYQEIYSISLEYLDKKGIDKSLWTGYLNLRNNLEWEFLKFHPQETNLPAPNQIQEVLETHPMLVQSLRKIGEIQTILERQNNLLINQQKPDIIQAQTQINLEGTLINRYTENILTHPQKDTILQIHQDNITFGQKHWRNFLQNILSFLQTS